ncbi:MAG: hypothetical protein ACP5MG_11210 [Verrucomicrobiia bacterium]|jgi:hypothetical protein
MKLMLMIGGFVGFGIGVILGVAQSGSWQDVIWKSAVAAYIAGFLMKWWGTVWIKSIQESESMRASQQPEKQEANAKNGV